MRSAHSDGHLLDPVTRVRSFLLDPATLFIKTEGHGERQMESERWRLIWNISDVDRLVDFWIHTDQDHLDVLHHQSEEAAQSSLATGCGHDDHGLERRCRVSSQLQMTRPSIAATLLRLGFGVPYFNTFFLKEPL